MLKGGSALWLLAALLSLARGQAAEDLLEVPSEPSPSDHQMRVPLDRFMLNENDDLAFGFGFRVLEELRQIQTNCEISRRQEELKFNTDITELMDYFRQTESFVGNKDFEALSKTNRDAIHKNFEDAFITAETARNDKLKEIQAGCDEEMDTLLSQKKAVAMYYIRYLITNDPAEFTATMFAVAEYRDQLLTGLSDCQDYYTILENTPNNRGIGDPFDLCYGREIDMLVTFISNFIAEAESESRKYFHSDDEDYSIGDLESGDYYYTDELPTPSNVRDNGIVRLPDPTGRNKPEADPVDEIKDIPATVNIPTTEMTTEARATMFETEGTPEATDTNEPPTTTVAASTDVGDKVIGNFFDSLEPGPVILPEDKGTTVPPTTEEIIGDFFDSLEPGPVILPVGQGTSPPPPVTTTELEERADSTGGDVKGHTAEATKPTEEWPKDAFNEVIEEVKAEEERERSQEDSGGPASKSSTKSHSSDSEDSSDDDDEGGWFEGGVDIDIPGVGEVEIGISHDGDEEGGLSIQAGLYEEGVVIDPLQGDGDINEEEDDSSFVGYFFTYFFVTIGVLVVLAIVMISLAVVISRRRSGNGYSPLLTEDEKVTVMKQSGYVNPTYKFFDQATSI